jgi:hypothetical protein
MPTRAQDFSMLHQSLETHARQRGVEIVLRELRIERPAEFDGISIVLNVRHDEEPRSYYLAHSFGSIAGWCVDLNGVQAMFEELRAAKKTRDADRDRLERALARP